jgi:hypothetical protein
MSVSRISLSNRAVTSLAILWASVADDPVDCTVMFGAMVTLYEGPCIVAFIEPDMLKGEPEEPLVALDDIALLAG